MAGTAMGSSRPHTTAKRRGVALDGPGEPVLVSPPLLDVADEPGQELLAVTGAAIISHWAADSSGSTTVAGLKVASTPAITVSRSSGVSSDSRWSGSPSSTQLARTELGQLDVDAAVGQGPVGDLHVPFPFEVAGQELAADRVPHVMGQQAEPVHPELGDQGHGQVGLDGHGVGEVRLVRQPVAEHVEEQDPPVGTANRSTTRWKSNEEVGKPWSTSRGGSDPVPAAGTSTVKTRYPHRSRDRPRARQAAARRFTPEPLGEEVEDLVEGGPGRGAGPVVEVLGEHGVGRLAVAVGIALATSRARRR